MSTHYKLREMKKGCGGDIRMFNETVNITWRGDGRRRVLSDKGASWDGAG